MSMFVGFDPGGIGAFGWCLTQGDSLPIKVIACGTAQHATDAVTRVLEAAGQRTIDAVGIDAPLFWRADGDRVVDAMLRKRITAFGARGGTVNSVNSMRGACLIQGIVAAQLMRQRVDVGLPITESHPKAMLWLLPDRPMRDRMAEWSEAELSSLVQWRETIGTLHERDAALGALSAFAMFYRASGWEDLLPLESTPIFPLPGPLGYWMPCARPPMPRANC